MYIKTLISLLILILMINTDMVSQVNVRIGYVAGFPQLPVNDNILANFSPVSGEVSKSFGSAGFMQGLQLGLRYRISNYGIELGWESMSRDRSALIFNPSNDSFTERTYDYSLSSYRAGIDNYFGKFGLGTALMYQRLKIDRVIGNNDLTLTNDRQLGLRIEFIWQVQKSPFISLEIRPYYQFSLEEYNLSALAEDLDVDTSVGVLESPKMWGISLVFYNGRQ